MGHYIYSSYLRREGKRRLAAALDPLTVAVGSSTASDHALFANVAVVVPFRSGDADDGPHESVRIAEFDIVLCDLADVTHVLSAAQRAGQANAIKVISLSGPTASLDGATLDGISQLMMALDLEMLSYQSQAVDFRSNRRSLFVLARKAESMRDSWRDLLKTAIGLEAHSLHGAAIEFVRHCNSVLGSDALDETRIDRTYEVEAFASGEYTRVLQRNTSAGAADPGEPVLSAVRNSDTHEGARHLSVHFDMLYRSDGLEQLLQLADSLACPEKTQIVVRVPGAGVSSQLESIAQTFRTRGAAIECFKDPLVTLAANPGAKEFVEITAPEACVAAYWGPERLPTDAGWDYEVLEAARSAVGTVFSFKTSNQKTRNRVAPEDAMIAPEGFPIVSRAWLEICRAWSFDKLTAGQFQSLVAFYFDRIDWMYKHRSLRLVPLMTLRTDPVPTGSDTGQEVRPSRSRYSAPPRAAEEEAIRIALNLHSRDWIDQHQGVLPPVKYLAAHRSLTLHDARNRQVLKTWSAKLARARVPL